MYGKLIAVSIIGAALSTAAFAQTQNATSKGQWQASKLIHMNVYNDQNQKIGDIKELMIDKSGKIDVVAVAVGGFLGMGEHDVAIKFDQLKWVNAPVSSTTSANDRPVTDRPATDRPAATTGSNTPSNSASAPRSDRTYPDHAVVSATKEQLKSMPQFDYNK